MGCPGVQRTATWWSTWSSSWHVETVAGGSVSDHCTVAVMALMGGHTCFRLTSRAQAQSPSGTLNGIMTNKSHKINRNWKGQRLLPAAIC